MKTKYLLINAFARFDHDSVINWFQLECEKRELFLSGYCIIMACATKRRDLLELLWQMKCPASQYCLGMAYKLGDLEIRRFIRDTYHYDGENV